MSTRPLTGPARWATDLSNNTPPSGPQQASGWVPNQDGVSDWDNWFKERTFTWLEYFADGDVELGDVHITGTLEVDGASQFDGATTHNAGIVLGTQKLKHGDKMITGPLNLVDCVEVTGGTVSQAADHGGSIVSDGAIATYRLLAIPWERRLKKLVVWGNSPGATIQLLKYDKVNGAYEPVTAVGGSGTANSFVGFTTSGTIEPLAPDEFPNYQYVLRVLAPTNPMDTTVINYDLWTDSV